jgi:hypothetical protein
MQPDESERLWNLVRTLLRHPEAVDDVEARRALTVLTSSRSDAAYLLLQRALVLELALERVKQQHALAGASPAATAAEGAPGSSASAAAPDAAATAAPAVPAAPSAAVAAGATVAPPRPSPFVRDAAVIAAGVVAGGLVLGGLDTLGEELGGDDLGLADWI